MDNTQENTQSIAGSQENQLTIIRCEPNVDISVVEDLFKHLKKAFDERHDVEIDTSQVARVDGTVLQLLCVFARDAKAAQMQVRWTQTSDAFSQAARSLGVEQLLGLSQAA